MAAAGTHASRRAAQDRCPGALRLHQAADGWLARIRVPGGRLTPRQLREIASAATDLGDGDLHLTSRGSAQVRGLAADAGADLTGRLTAAGLLPSLARDRIRNVVASPFAAGGDVDHVVARLDALLCGEPGLERLSGRFLFAVDDGSWDVAADADLAAVAETADPEPLVRLWVDGCPTGVTAGPGRAADLLVRAASLFLDMAGDAVEGAWRVRDLPAGSVGVLVAAVERDVEAPAWGGFAGAVRRAHGHGAADPAAAGPVRATPPLGVVGEPTRQAVHALPHLGSAPAACWLAVADAAEASTMALPIRLTPWRTVVIAGLESRTAARALDALSRNRFAVDPASPWVGVSACAGRPRCASALADVRADAPAVAAEVRAAATPGHAAYAVHLSGCERRCGHPSGPHHEVLATGEGTYVTTRPGS